jgi:restriction system protein
MVSPASQLRGADRHGESVGGHEAVGDCPYHRAEMRITYLFLPLYFGLLAGLVGHSVRAGLVGAAVGLVLAVLLAAEGNRRGRTDGMAAIDAMTGTEFEDYVAARLQRAGWRVQFTPASGDYGVDLIGAKDGNSVAVQCKRLGKPVGVAAVQQVVAGARHHGCTRSIVISNQEFTGAAKQLAHTHNCQLIGRRALQAWVPPPARRAV